MDLFLSFFFQVCLSALQQHVSVSDGRFPCIPLSLWNETDQSKQTKAPGMEKGPWLFINWFIYLSPVPAWLLGCHGKQRGQIPSIIKDTISWSGDPAVWIINLANELSCKRWVSPSSSPLKWAFLLLFNGQRNSHRSVILPPLPV